MTVIVSHHVEAPASVALTPGQKEYVDGRAIIGYHSILDAPDIVISATSEASGYPAGNVAARLTYGGWRPSGTGTQYLTFTGTAGHAVDYVAIAGHDLGSKGAPIDVEYHDGSAWISMYSGGLVPVSDAPIMLLLTRKEALSFRIKAEVAPGSIPTIAAILIGERLSLQRGIYVGHSPATYSPDVHFLTEESEGGQIIGSSVLSTAFEVGIEIKRITPAWARPYLVPFLKKARNRQPFAFMWNTDDRYKGEVIYGTLTNNPELSNDHQSFMSCELRMRGLA